MAHITGGGITENLPRTLPAGCAAEIDRRSWDVPPIFAFLQARGGIADDEMLRAFNMGVGLIVCVDGSDASRASDMLKQSGEQPIALGRIVKGDRDVRYRHS
jgi:phosphoribosylformylglycinamidine cyclo-ligase